MDIVDHAKHRLFDAAGQVFAEKGFEGAKVREICKHANVNLASVNYYFGDKERLYIETVKQAACGLPDRAQTPWPPDTPPAVKLSGFIRTMLSHLMNKAKPAWHTKIMMRELAQPTLACEELVREYIAPTANVLVGILSEMLPPHTPRWKCYMFGFSIVGQCLYYLQNKPIARLLVGADDFRWFDEAHLAEHITQFSLAALAPKDDGGRMKDELNGISGL